MNGAKIHLIINDQASLSTQGMTLFGKHRAGKRLQGAKHDADLRPGHQYQAPVSMNSM